MKLVHSRFWVALVISFGLILTNEAKADPICDLAALGAAEKTGVPIAILKAISIAETGRSASGKSQDKLQSWPWTVNTGGTGHWFNNRQIAEDFVASRLAQGTRNIDVGCFQLNFHWHGHGFRNIGAMFDPSENATYAAKFLQDLYLEMGDWRSAVGAYHSRTPEQSEAYLVRLERLHRGQARGLVVAEKTPVQLAEMRKDKGQKPLRGASGPLILRVTNPLPLIGTFRP
jgi:hypothetical protein